MSSPSMPAQTPVVATCLHHAEELKAEGNDYFRAGRWNEALAAYRSGLGELPRRTKLIHQPDLQNTEETVEEPNLATELDKDCSKARAILHANIAACYVKLGEHKEAVEACTQALSDDPEYLKALQRRALSNEMLGTWSSLSAAQEGGSIRTIAGKFAEQASDYNTLSKILPESDSRRKDVSSALQQLKPRIEVAQKRETAEMLDKLKGVGNSILGRFGLSTDNFQFVPNEQGGYSVNFTR